MQEGLILRSPLARLGLALALGVGAASAAWADSMTCRMDPTANGRYIAPSVSVTWDAFGTAKVSDAVIAATGRKGQTGEIAPSNGSKVIVLWEVPNVTPDPLETRRRDAHLVVRLTVQRASGAALMTVQDASNRKYSYRSTGACTFQG